MDWVTIDFEASCLPRDGRSFPIEVGLCGPRGTWSWLIRPLPEWRQWDWTDEAARLHGIGRELLDEQGLDAALVADELRRAIGGARVVADSTLDRAWWQLLLSAAAPAAIAPIIIEHVSAVFDELGATAAQIEAARQRADELCPERHRAGSDARWLFTLLSALEQPVAADRAGEFPSWTSRNAYAASLAQPQTITEKIGMLVQP